MQPTDLRGSNIGRSACLRELTLACVSVFSLSSLPSPSASRPPLAPQPLPDRTLPPAGRVSNATRPLTRRR